MEEMMITVECVCPFCGEEYSVAVPLMGYLSWEHGMPIQTALPNVSATIRECLISNICSDCQEKYFN